MFVSRNGQITKHSTTTTQTIHGFLAPANSEGMSVNGGRYYKELEQKGTRPVQEVDETFT